MEGRQWILKWWISLSNFAVFARYGDGIPGRVLIARNFVKEFLAHPLENSTLFWNDSRPSREKRKGKKGTRRRAKRKTTTLLT